MNSNVAIIVLTLAGIATMTSIAYVGIKVLINTYRYAQSKRQQ